MSRDPPVLNPLSANNIKWSNTLKQSVGSCRRIVWVHLTILWGWRLKGYHHHIISILQSTLNFTGVSYEPYYPYLVTITLLKGNYNVLSKPPDIILEKSSVALNFLWLFYQVLVIIALAETELKVFSKSSDHNIMTSPVPA